MSNIVINHVVRLLLAGDGPDGGTTFTDSGHDALTLSAVGSPVISTAQGRFGGSSLFFGNVDGNSLTLPGAITLISDFTVECWLYRTGLSPSGYAILVSHDTISVQVIRLDAGGNLAYYNQGAFITSTATVALNTWVHVAVARQNFVTRIFHNGVLVGSGADTMPLSISQINGLGSGYNYSYHGYVDDLRITGGLARYTDDFTPPGELLLEALDLDPVVVEASVQACMVPVLRPGSAAIQPVCRVNGRCVRDMENGGAGRIAGSVKEAHTPTDTPVIRCVRLHRKTDGMMLRETWSAADGSYAFANIDAAQQYYVVGFDHTGHYNGVIRDSITPVLA